MPFTVDAVTQWIVQRYRDQICQRGLSAAVGTNFFSLLYECPAEWLRIIEALSIAGKAVSMHPQ